MNAQIKILFIAIFAMMPAAVFAQADLAVEPIADSGLEIPEEIIEQPEEVVVEEVMESIPVFESVEIPEPRIHLEQLNWNTFRFRPSFRLGQEAYSTVWSFGDEQGSEERIIQHSYEKPGTYQVRLELFDEEGERQLVSTTIHVGFFNLANWRLWVMILILALIIIVSAIVAGSSEEAKNSRKKKRKKFIHEEEDVINSLSEETGDLDSLAEIGFDTKDWGEELAFLEDMILPKKKSPRKKAVKTKKKKVTVKKTTKEKKKKTSTRSKSTKTKKKATKKKTTKSKTSRSKKAT